MTARILQVRRYYLPEPSLKLVLKLETVDIDGTPRPLIAQPDSRAVATRLDNQDPKAAVLEFLESTYDAGAKLGNWDRGALEKHS